MFIILRGLKYKKGSGIPTYDPYKRKYLRVMTILNIRMTIYNTKATHFEL